MRGRTLGARNTAVRRCRLPVGAAVLAALLAAVPCGAQQSAAGAAPTGPLTLQAAIDLALQQNLEIAAVRRGRAVREADIRAAGVWDNPEFSAEVTRDVPHGDLSVGFPIDIAGARSRRVAVAREALALADADERLTISRVRRDLRVAFFAVLGADREQALAEDALTVARRVRDTAQARFEEGAAPRLDVMAADMGVARAQTELDKSRSARRVAQAELNAILNLAPGTPVTLAGDLADVPSIPPFEGAMAEAAVSNADLLAADREAAVESRQIDVLKAERVPKPVFFFGTALNAPGEFDVGPHAGVSLSIPLFARNQGEIAGSQARLQQLQTLREAVRRQVEAEVFAAIERVAASRTQVESLEKTLVPTATSLQDLAEESYRMGRNSILVALEALRALRDVKLEYVQALLELQAAIADLEALLGGPIQ